MLYPVVYLSLIDRIFIMRIWSMFTRNLFQTAHLVVRERKILTCNEYPRVHWNKHTMGKYWNFSDLINSSTRAALFVPIFEMRITPQLKRTDTWEWRNLKITLCSFGVNDIMDGGDT